MKHTIRSVALAALSLTPIACGQESKAPPPAPAKADTPAPSAAPKAAAPAEAPAGKATPAIVADAPFNVEVFQSNLQVVWDMAWAPDGRIFLNERVGRVRVIDKAGKLLDAPALTIEGVWKQPAENGLMGLCLHPDFAKNHFVYLSYGQQSDGKDIRVVRYTESNNTLSEPKVLLAGLPAGPNHAGCRVRFGPDGKLYITAGEKFQGDLAQDLSSLGGKILRLNDDGTIPADNPFNTAEGKAKGWRGEIWSYGHRNPQGIDWNDQGVLMETEHGPSGEAGSGGDEINIVEKGKNYGWNVIHHDLTKEGMVSPIRQFDPAIAPASAAVCKGDKFAAWKGSLLFGGLGGLRGGRAEPGLYRVEIQDGKVVKEERYLADYGRIRFVAIGPDGLIYVTTSNKDGRAKARDGDDKILKLTPKP